MKEPKTYSTNTVSTIFIANLLVFALTYCSQNTAWGKELKNLLMFNSQELTNGLSGQPLTLFHSIGTMFTYQFVHSGRNHLVSNMTALILFGPVVETELGAKKFLALYFVSGLVGVICLIAVYPDAIASARGASAAICALMSSVVALTVFKRIQWSIWTSGSTLLVLYLLVSEITNINHSASSGIAHAAHVGGIIAGFVLTSFFALQFKRGQS